MPPEGVGAGDALDRLLTAMVDPGWYQARYPDVAAAGMDPVAHFIRFGFQEIRDPNRLFDSTWYQAHYPDVAASDLNPLRHYLQAGAAEQRNPHPRFDAAFYVDEHPDAAANPLLYHLQVGLSRGYLTEPPVNIRDYLPSEAEPSPLPSVFVDVIILVCRGDRHAEQCIASVLADRALPLARVIVVDDRAAKPRLTAWLRQLAAAGQIHLMRNPRPLGFPASVRLGIDAAGTQDVVVLHGGIEVFRGWLPRLAACAWSDPRIATVSPLSNPGPGSVARYTMPTFGQPPALLDEICRSVNSGRSVSLPAAAGNCHYFRRDALSHLGGFNDPDNSAVDFCRRATEAGWQHRLACDTFVYCTGSRQDEKPQDRPSRNHPGPGHEPARQAGNTDPFRFAVTAALFRQSNLPVILMISHDMGGGVRRHIDSLVRRYRGKAHIFLLEGTDRGVGLSVPDEPNHPVLKLPAGRMDDLVLILRSANLSRAHIHHQLHLTVDLRRLILRLGVPFDVTVHDYYAICPQINLLPWPEGLYCGEPEPGGCNACIADLCSHGATDIVSWRREKAWQFIEAERVICPSADVRTRLARHGVGEQAIVAPHERQAAANWPVTLPVYADTPLRVVLLGVLANHKGARTVASVAEAAEAAAIEIHLIGHTEPSFPKPALKLIKATGRYREADLDKLVVRAKPHVFWFPSSAPETYSYTLSIAIATGVPIVATRLGSFPERLAGRPNTWLTDHDASAQDLLAIFEQIKVRLRDPQPAPSAPRPAAVGDFYDKQYLAARNDKPTGRRNRRATRPRAVILPERYANGALTPSAYTRLLLPLDHPMIGGGADIVMATTQTVFDAAANIIVTQRAALTDVKMAEKLAAHASRVGARLVYDLDDDLLTVASNHPAASQLRLQAKVVRRLLTAADAVWLSTQGLANRLAFLRPDALVIETRLDERLWSAQSLTTRCRPEPCWDDPIRILCMATGGDNRDFALIEPALTRLAADYGPRIVIDVLGMTGMRELPPGLNRVSPTWHAARSDPGFVNWLSAKRPVWHIGLAPLRDTPFNRSKSSIEATTCAALGLATLASDVPAYRGSIADGPAGQLVRNDPAAWHAALDWLIRDQSLRRSIGDRAHRAFAAQGTLLSQAEQRRSAWASLLAKPVSCPPAGLAV